MEILNILALVGAVLLLVGMAGYFIGRLIHGRSGEA